MWLGLLALLPQSILSEVTNDPAQLSGVARAQLASSAQSNFALSRRMWAAAGDASFQESWLQFSSGGLAIGCDSSNIKCKHWKAGNNAIQLLVDKAKYKELEELRRSSLCARGAVSFTFVREPLSHFLSGFTEYAFRAWKGLTEIDTTFAKATLMTILGGRKPNVTGGSALRHVYPMSGVLSAGWRFDWVGVLEHADSAWEELANFSRSELVRNTKLDSSLGAHPTSSDPQGARAAMVAVLRREPELRGRLCSLLLADFACFGYDIQACRDGRALPSALRHGTQ